MWGFVIHDWSAPRFGIRANLLEQKQERHNMKNATYVVSGDDKQLVTLTEQQQVHLNGINEDDIQSAVMEGEDLVVTLHDGRVITIENFGVYDWDTTLEIVDDAEAIFPVPIILSSLAGIGGVAALSGSSSNDTTGTVAAPTAELNADTGASATDGVTNDGTVNVTLAADAASWEFSTDGGATWTAGTGESFTLPEGTYAEGDVQVRQTDAAGNTSAAAELAAVTVDQSIDAPAAALNADTGLVTDNDIAVPVGTQNTWEFSTDGGATWTAGTGTSFTVPAAEYQDGDIQYREVATNPSSVDGVVTEYNFDDPSAPTATYTFPDDFAGEVSTDGGVTWGAVAGPVTGPAFTDDVQVRQTDILNDNFYSDGVTNDGTVNVTLAADAASWEYSTDGGTTWFETAVGATNEVGFTLAEGTYAEGDVQVRQTDAAGNTSAVVDLGAVEVDQSIDAPAAALNADTGVSDNDGRTNDGTVNITLADEAVTWEVSTDGGTTWFEIAVGATNEVGFTLAEGTYAEGDVQVRQTDAAGNTSAVVELAAVEVVDLVQATATVAGPGLSADMGDVDNDGNIDLAIGEPNLDGFYTYYAGNGDGTLADRTVVGDPQSQPNSVVLEDFNGDGNLDLLTADGFASGNRIELQLGNGDGTFGAATLLDTVGGGAVSLEAGDVDGDGNLDFVAVSPNGDSVELFYGNGDGTFDPAVAIDSAFDAARGSALGDFDGDGDVDILATGGGSFSSQVQYYENNGDGTFAAGKTVLDGFTIGNAVDAGDFNGDGNLDFVLANKGTGASEGGLSVLLGNGDGTFGGQSVIQEGWNVLATEVADFNGDGVLDIAGATPNADDVVGNFALWIGNGDGTFQDALIVAETSGAYSLTVGDLNNDGLLDITGVDRFNETFEAYVLEVV